METTKDLVIWEPGKMHIVDFIVDGKTSVNKIPMDDYVLLNPNCIIIEWEEVSEKIREIENREYLKPWGKITREQYEESLNCLPPEKWENCRGWSIFRMCEYLVDNITSHYISTKHGYYSAYRRTSQKYTELCSELWNQLPQGERC